MNTLLLNKWPLMIAGMIATFMVFFLVSGLSNNDFSIEFSPPGNMTAAVLETVAHISTTTPAIPVVEPPLLKYVEVTGGCGINYEEECVVLRSGPGISYPVVMRLRNGMVLRVADTVVGDEGAWYKIQLDKEILYPERVTGDWFVSADVVRSFYNVGDRDLKKDDTVTTKRIVVDLSEQTLYAYDGDVLFMQELVSTGLTDTPTPRGTFTVFRMTPSRYMQGPLPGVSGQEYDLPGVPWDLYFTDGGAVIHGAYWHNSFGKKWSHGCVNLAPEKAKELYQWAEIGMSVTVRD